MAIMLVADDDAAVRESLAALVDILGHQCICAANGKHALMQAAAAPPDLIITDARMPLMNGRELLRAVRSDARLAHIPALVFTSTGEAGVQEALACGAQKALIRPGDPRELVAAIRSPLEYDG